MPKEREPKETAAEVSAAARFLALLATGGVGLNSLRSNNARPFPPAAALLSTASTARGTKHPKPKCEDKFKFEFSRYFLDFNVPWRVYFLCLLTRPNVVLALSSARRGGRERGE